MEVYHSVDMHTQLPMHGTPPPMRTSIRCVGCATNNCVRLHYGAPSCHGCKAFFRRTVFGGRVYVCSADNTCNTSNALWCVERARKGELSLNRLRHYPTAADYPFIEARNSCRACRMNNCLRGGMNPKLVREERMRGSLLASSPEDVSYSETDGEQWGRVVPPSVQVCNDGYYGLVRFLCALDKEAEMNTDPQEPGAVFAIKRYPLDWSCSRIMGPADVYSQWSRAFILHTDWAMGIPEYRALSLEDQALIFKNNFPCFGWITYAFKCHVNKLKTKGMPLGNGAFVPVGGEDLTHLDPVWEKTYGLICRKLMDEVVSAMADLNITFEEYCLIKTIALFQIDSMLTEDGHVACQSFRDKLQEALSSQISTTFPYLSPINKSNRILKLALLLPSFTHIGHLESDMIRMLSLPHPAHMAMQATIVPQ